VCGLPRVFSLPRVNIVHNWNFIGAVSCEEEWLVLVLLESGRVIAGFSTGKKYDAYCAGQRSLYSSLMSQNRWA
jgi:hypothetical protein